MRRREDFLLALRRGRRAGRRRLVLYMFAETGDHNTPARVGFVVGKAIGGAVQRNKVRRRLQHVVRERLHAVPAGSLLVVRAKPPAADARLAEISQEFDSAFERLLEPRPRL